MLQIATRNEERSLEAVALDLEERATESGAGDRDGRGIASAWFGVTVWGVWGVSVRLGESS